MDRRLLGPKDGNAETTLTLWFYRILTAHAVILSICSALGFLGLSSAASPISGYFAGLALWGFLVLGSLYWVFSWPLASWFETALSTAPSLIFYPALAWPIVVWAMIWLRAAVAVVRNPRWRRLLPVAAIALYGSQFAGFVYGLYRMANYD